MLILTKEALEEIKSHGQNSYPYEGCGLLLGNVRDGVNEVSKIQPLANVWPDEEEKRIRFRIDEADWRDVELAAMVEDLDVVGVFHSHPDSPPIASPRDLAWAAWPGYSYLITAVEGGKAGHSRSWQLLHDRSGFTEEKIQEVSCLKV